MKKVICVLSIILCVSSFVSCSSDDEAAGPATITIEFDNVAGDANLELNTSGAPYVNGKGEPFNVTNLRYYVSSILLKRTDGTVYADPVSADGSAGYYLVDESDSESQEVMLTGVPEGNYTEITFTIGVDAGQVNQGAQTGALDPAHGLFWSWNSGYVFLALEGTSTASTETGDVFQYHVGGYKTDPENETLVNNVKTITRTFNGEEVPVKAGHSPEVHLLFDVKKFLDGAGEQVSFTAAASRHTPKACEAIAGNIPGAFTVDHVHAN